MKRDFESILDECLHDIEEGQATIEMCVARYAQHAERLEALLRVAERVRTADHPQLPPSVMVAIEGCLLRRAVELREARARAASALERRGEATPHWVGVKPPRIFSFGWLRVATVTLVLILALVLAGGGVMVASAASLPGSPLYGVKRTTERVQFALTFGAADRAVLHLKFAERRLEEAAVLAVSRREFDEDTLSALNEEIELALLEARTVSEQDSMALWESIVDWTERQQRALQGMQCQALEGAQPQLVTAFETSQRAQAEAIQVLKKERPVPQPSSTPRPTPTPEPTSTPESTVKPTEKPALELTRETSTLGTEEEPTGQLPSEPKMKPSAERRHPVAEKIAVKFEVDYSEITDLHTEGIGFGVISRAYFLAGELGLTVNDIVEMKQSGMGWRQFMHEFGVHPGSYNLGRIMSGKEEPPGKSKDKEKGGPPPEPPGQVKDKEGPPPEPPGQVKDKEGPPPEPPGQEKEKKNK